jgi:hypothetical protein
VWDENVRAQMVRKVGRNRNGRRFLGIDFELTEKEDEEESREIGNGEL